MDDKEDTHTLTTVLPQEYQWNWGGYGSPGGFTVSGNTTGTLGAMGSTTVGSTVVPTVGTITSSPYVYSNSNIWTTLSNSPYAAQVGNDGRLELQGDNADIVINGESLSDRLSAIEQRLNILRPNAILEAQWDQLRELGEQYRRLEAELQEKQRMWDALKQQTPESK